MRVDLHRTKSKHEPRELRQEGNRKWVRVSLWVMIIALVSWYFLGDTQPKSDNQTQSGESSTAFRVPLTAQETEKSSSISTLPFTSMINGKQARDIIKDLRAQGEKINLDDVFRRAEQFKSEGMMVDAHLMYFFSARQGHADSAMVLGTMYDPEHTLKAVGIIDEPNWGQAHKWYLRAAEGGNQAAKKRLQYLREQVEHAAAEGDPEASRLILQWQ
uniref:Sel1 repeat-containing protein n=1 Tax=Candidatus Kentrum sp. FW TaxID=2126338 RepID=A0A450SQD3_9GAMM|nr:MAG: hypothetical protein BECKFW1821B_GA0114236_102619 [Candidatus Kentron sp. FW]